MPARSRTSIRLRRRWNPWLRPTRSSTGWPRRSSGAWPTWLPASGRWPSARKRHQGSSPGPSGAEIRSQVEALERLRGDKAQRADELRARLDELAQSEAQIVDREARLTQEGERLAAERERLERLQAEVAEEQGRMSARRQEA